VSAHTHKERSFNSIGHHLDAEAFRRQSVQADEFKTWFPTEKKSDFQMKKVKGKKTMKNTLLILTLVLFASVAKADDLVVRWRQIVGVITAPNVDNPVATTLSPSPIHSGTLPWTTKGGHASVNLSTGAVSFDVDGLVLNGGDFSGTLPSGFPKIVGTLVCNAGMPAPATVDTPQVPISKQGDADFSGQFTTSIPAPCSNPLFLIRVPAFGGKWIATGALPVISDNNGN
jgi:hypothetical protein